MTNGAKLLIKWLKENVLNTYQEPVNSNASLPYISLSYVENEFASQTAQQLTIWTRSDASYQEAYSYADKLSKLIGESGVLVKDNDLGTIAIYKGSPFCQNRLDDTTTIRAVLVNLLVINYNN